MPSSPATSAALNQILRRFSALDRVSGGLGGLGDHTHPKESIPTILVAASDARDEVREMADFVCDGVEDEAEIQAAINELPFGGGRIVLSAGEFAPDWNKITLGQNDHLVGQGVDATEINMNLTNPTTGVGPVFQITGGASFASISHLTILMPSNGLVTQIGVQVNGVGGVHIHDVFIDSSEGEGIHIGTGAGTAITWVYNNRITECKSYGIFVHSVGTGYTKVFDNFVQRTSEGTAVALIHSDGADDIYVLRNVVLGGSIEFDGGDRGVIESNVVVNSEGNADSGIFISGSHCRVQNNTVIDASIDGIHVGGGTHNLITGNSIINTFVTHQSGIWSAIRISVGGQNSTVSDNTIDGGGNIERGIQWMCNDIDGASIVGNVISDTVEVGIHVDDTFNGGNDVVIANNLVRGVGGIFVDWLDGCTIVGNHVILSSGIPLEFGGNGLDKIIIDGNWFRTTDSDAGAHVIEFTGTSTLTNGQISNNFLSTAGGWGIFSLDDFPIFIKITNNMFDQCNQGGMRFRPTDNSHLEIAGNKFTETPFFGNNPCIDIDSGSPTGTFISVKGNQFWSPNDKPIISILNVNDIQVLDNIAELFGVEGILLDTVKNATVARNHLTGAIIGIDLINVTQSMVSENIIIQAQHHAIALNACSDNQIQNNQMIEPSQETPDTWDGLFLEMDSDRNYIHGNKVIPAVAETRYGIFIKSGLHNIVVGNELGQLEDYASLPLFDWGNETQLVYPSHPVWGDNFVDDETVKEISEFMGVTDSITFILFPTAEISETMGVTDSTVDVLS